MSTAIPKDLVEVRGPIPSSSFIQLAMVLGVLGIVSLGWFLVTEITAGKRDSRGVEQKRNIWNELILALVTSVLLGSAGLFVLLYGGIYV
jgi:Oligosaccharyltransferase subunit 5